MRILYLLQDRNFFSQPQNEVGGHIAHIHGIIDSMIDDGHELFVASLNKIPFLAGKSLTYNKIKQIEFKIPVLAGIICHWVMTKQIIKFIKEIKPDLIYVRWSSNIFFYKIKASNPKIKIVSECNSFLQQSTYYGFIRKKLAKWEDKQIEAASTKIVVISEKLSQAYCKIFGDRFLDKIIVAPNGVDVDFFKPFNNNLDNIYKLNDDTVIIGFSGNFAPWHRLDLLIEAVQRMPGNIHLVLIGTSRPEFIKSLQKLIASKNRNRIIFTGKISFKEMPKYLASCSILAVPQDDANNHRSPIKLFEYMAMQKPVIASRVGQIASIIQDGKNGLLFNNSTEDVIDSINKIIKDKALSDRISLQARKDACEKHSWENSWRIIKSNL